jgi:dehydrogenase/reductase SDR family protein 7B
MSNVYWITGASSGIGKALCQEVAKNGNKVIISARNEEKLKAIKGENPDISILPFDLENFDSSIVEKAKACFGKIDVLVNNGGLSQRSLARDTTIDIYERLMKVNYLGQVKLTLEVLKHFREIGAGQFVTTSSLTGKFGTPFRSGYAASKHALHGFYDSLRAEEIDSNIKVTIICPGFVKTEVSMNAVTADGTKQGKMDGTLEKAYDPIDFSKKMYRAILSGKNEVYIGGYELFGVYLKRFMPNTFAKVIARAKVK